uniref:SP110 nuclear body protein variant 24 n=1 Tax=Sus scrofa TaxID=9823 RepID=S5AAU4_PIG|nr:SP110 nuclear body protein variant 24 [Sus scrofa]
MAVSVSRRITWPGRCCRRSSW